MFECKVNSRQIILDTKPSITINNIDYPIESFKVRIKKNNSNSNTNINKDTISKTNNANANANIFNITGKFIMNSDNQDIKQLYLNAIKNNRRLAQKTPYAEYGNIMQQEQLLLSILKYTHIEKALSTKDIQQHFNIPYDALYQKLWKLKNRNLIESKLVNSNDKFNRKVTKWYITFKGREMIL